MKLVDLVKEAQEQECCDKSGKRSSISCYPPFSAEELNELRNSIPCQIPADLSELLSYCSGFEIDFSEFLDGVFFITGESAPDFTEMLSPTCVTIARDGFGNYWAVDLSAESTEFGPVFYLCHDPPVVVYQSDSLFDFITEVLKLGREPWESSVSEVHKKCIFKKCWYTHEQCLDSGDSELESFAKSLDDSYTFFDLRKPEIGSGFEWPNSDWRRFGNKRIFAIQMSEEEANKAIYVPAVELPKGATIIGLIVFVVVLVTVVLKCCG